MLRFFVDFPFESKPGTCNPPAEGKLLTDTPCVKKNEAVYVKWPEVLFGRGWRRESCRFLMRSWRLSSWISGLNVSMAKQIRITVGDREIQGDDYFVVIEPVFWSVSIYDGPEQYEKDLANFSAEQRLVLAYHWYLSEVNNGGHHQFYDNSTGLVWPDALEAFREIGHSDVVAIINESIRRFGGTPSLDREERQEQLKQIESDFEDLDRELFRVEELAGFDEKVLEFIRAHRESFLFSGVVKR